MQDKSDRLNVFLDRFNALAVQFGHSAAATCKAIGISRSLFYEIRDGKRDLTRKMEERLTAAEKDLLGTSDEPAADNMLRDGVAVYRTSSPKNTTDEAIDAGENVLLRIALALERIAESLEKQR